MTVTAFRKDDVETYVAEQETITLWFVRKETRETDGEVQEVDVPLFWADVRADLTFAERERMQKAIQDLSAPIERRLEAENKKKPKADRLDDIEIKRKASVEVEVKDLWGVMAPYVLGWSVGELVDGKKVPIDPPAVGGAEQFQYISESFTNQIFVHLWTRSQGDVDVDFLGRLKRTENRSGNGNIAVMKTGD